MNDQPLPFEAMFYKAQNEIAALRATVTALEKERDELKLALSNANQLIGSQADENDRTVANILKERDQLRAEVSDLRVYSNVLDAIDRLVHIPGAHDSIEAIKAHLKEKDQLHAACAAKIDREDLRQTVDLLDRMQVTGKVNHEKLQAELLRLESLLNPKGTDQ